MNQKTIKIILQERLGVELNEALAFLNAVSTIDNENIQEPPKLQLYDSEKEGFSIWIKITEDKPDFPLFIKQTAKTHGLQTRQFQDFIIINSY